MSSWNQIKNDLLTFARSHPQINSFGTGDPLAIGTDNCFNLRETDRDRLIYPLVFFVVEPSNIASRVRNLNVTMLMMDRMENERKTNDQDPDNPNYWQDMEDEVVSDMLDVVSDLMANFIDNPDIEYTLSDNVPLTPFFDTRDDRVAGWRAALTFEIPYSRSVCIIPD
jgi:hypothetical protein